MSRIKVERISRPLMTVRLPDGKRRLVRALEVKIGERLIAVPADTITDFSSIPWFGRGIVRWSCVDVAGVVHDWLYGQQQIGDKSITRAEADFVWYLVAIAGQHRANLFQAGVCWLSLRLAGWTHWNKGQK